MSTSSAERPFLRLGSIHPADPNRSADALAEADRVAWRRVTGGVHYPSDLAGSLHVAEAVRKALLKSEKFASTLKEVEAELARDPL
ncbi:MAG: hypothetical protein C0474_00735 [Sphingobium sp.]|nr:hypothetical protein [Sphingobium sp.]